MVGMLSVATCVDAQPSMEVASGSMEFTRGHTEEGGFGFLFLASSDLRFPGALDSESAASYCHDCLLLWEFRPLELRTRCGQLGHLSVLGLLCFTLRLWDYQCGLWSCDPLFPVR